ncbi:acyl-CoA carboxylase subunit epsilon [Streptomyces sp. NPDC048362]|uniref:acyl-CoA carboxylase subunit epsilon n=1 Tax=Streptomyces sp. NPDC048362 TaxID=3365539 RepID=UPI003713F6A4
MTAEDPLFRVVRGVPLEHELAALTAVIYGLARREDGEPGDTEPPAAGWGRPTAQAVPAGAWTTARTPSWRPNLP